MSDSLVPVELLEPAPLMGWGFRPYVQALKDEPFETLECVGRLWAKQKGLMVDETGDLCITLTTLSLCFSAHAGYKIDEDDAHACSFPKPEGDIWAACVTCELPELLLEMVQDDIFFEQPRPWIQAVLDLNAAVLCIWVTRAQPSKETQWLCFPQSLAERCVQRLPAVWDLLWSNIDSLLLHVNPYRLHGIASELVILADYTTLLYNKVHTERQGDLLQSIAVVGVSLAAWTDICSDPQSKHYTQHDYAFNAITRYRYLVYESKGYNSEAVSCWRSIIDESLDLVGPSKFMRTCHAVLSSWPSMFAVNLQSCLKALECILSTDFIDDSNLQAVEAPIHKAFWDLSMPMLDAVAKALERESRSDNCHLTPFSDACNRTRICISGCRLLGLAKEGFVQLENPVGAVDARGAYKILSLCLLMLGGALEDAIAEAVTELALTGANAFDFTCRNWFESIVPEIKSSADEGWYKDMCLLRSRRERLGGNDNYKLLVRSWIAFGKTMGLDETAERDRRDKLNKHLCSWILCQYHSQPSPTRMSTCVGCGEQKYCSRNCQKIDWKQGGHRSKCRRLTA